MPVRLEYRFTGSALGSIAVLLARCGTPRRSSTGLRVLAHVPAQAAPARPRSAERADHLPLVSVDRRSTQRRRCSTTRSSSWRRRRGRRMASSSRCLTPAACGPPATGSARPSRSSPIPESQPSSLRRSRRCGRRLRERVAAAVLESRLGGGSRRSSFFPGNVRTVVGPSGRKRGRAAQRTISKRPRRESTTRSSSPGSRRAASARSTRRTRRSRPLPAPLVRPHLAGVVRHARARGRAARRTHGPQPQRSRRHCRWLRRSRAVAGADPARAGGALQRVGLVLVLPMWRHSLLSGIHAALRFRSLVVGVLEPPAVVGEPGRLSRRLRARAERRARASSSRAARPSRSAARRQERTSRRARHGSGEASAA